jgi:hypothetical protein
MDDATRTMIANLQTKTGTTMAEWVKRVAKSGKAKHGEVVAWLKSEHGLSHGYANLVAHMAKGSAASTSGKGDDALVAAQYAGAKAGLTPIYDKLIAAVRKLGGDVELAPKNAYVSLRRSKQFGLIQPSTASRVDVGITLKGTPPAGRLEAAGSWNSMVTHRVRLGSAAEVDKELIGWLKTAYEQA